MVDEDEDVDAPDSRSATTTDTSNVTSIKAHKKNKKTWTRAAHGTRGASKRAQAVALQEESRLSGGVVNAALEKDPTSYSEAMCSNKRDGWVKAMEEEVEALQKNKVWQVAKRAWL